MKYKYILISFALMLFSYSTMYATSSTDQQYQRWMSDLRKYKQNFLIKEISLSSKQQQEFFPLYNSMEKEIYDINKEARTVENKITAASSVTDDEYENATEKMLAVKGQEAQIENRYYQKFSKILSKKQLFRLQRAEIRFSKNMLQHHKEAQKKTR